MDTAISDTQSIVIAKPASEVFAFMADPGRLDLWSFGTWKTEPRADGLIAGRSIFDGSTVYVGVDPLAERLLVDYRIGATPDQLQARIFARVTPGPVAGLDKQVCVLTLTAIRTSGMPSERWQRLVASHAFELRLIQSALETGYDHRSERKLIDTHGAYHDSRG